jgi:hypothetical protein
MTPTNLIIAGLALALALVTGLLGWQTVRLANEQKAHQTTVATFAQLREKQATQAKTDIEAVRAEEHRRIFALEGVIHEQAKLAASARADADAADLAFKRLRDKANRLATSTSQRPTNPTTPAAGQTAEPAAMVLADVLGSLGQRAVDLGRFADESRSAGLACEASYDAVRADNGSD